LTPSLSRLLSLAPGFLPDRIRDPEIYSFRKIGSLMVNSSTKKRGGGELRRRV